MSSPPAAAFACEEATAAAVSLKKHLRGIISGT
jgi:hypothetical protein